MKGWNVTITGADDGVDPQDLLKLGREFPFVEWALLVSAKRTGQPRYPSETWFINFLQATLDEMEEGKPNPRLAMHFCGSAVEAVMEGDDPPMPREFFQRVQLNGFSVEKAQGFRGLEGLEVILQTRAEEDLQRVADFIAARPGLNASILFDPSCGRGIEAFRWPPAPFGVKMGYAGGINPENVAQVLGDIVASNTTLADDIWIDLETGARDENNRFDLGRVRSLLEQVAPVNARFV